MKTQRIVLSLVVLVLTACGQKPMSNARQGFTKQAGSQVDSYVSKLSNSLRPTTKGSPIAGRGIAYGGIGSTGYQSNAFDIFSYSGSNPYGGYVLPQSMEEDRTGCSQFVAQVPSVASYYAPAMATLARCLNRVLNYRNPILTWASTQLDPNSLDRWSYAVDYTRVGPYGAYGGYTGTFGGFVLGGVLQRDR